MPDAINGPSMNVADIGQATGTQASQSQLDKDTFLQLLVAQLKYQNPLAPTDGSEFLAQSAQFTMVEKLEELSRTMSDAAVHDRLATATGMIGRQITYRDETGETASGLVTGVRFELAGPILILGDTEVALGSVEAVRAAEASAELTSG